MYNGSGVVAGGGAAGGGTLAATGASTLWVVLAAFAILAVGTAIVRIVPKKG